MFTEDFELLKRSISDNIIEPIRAREIPHFQELKDVALSAGSVGFGVSGSGPSVFALAQSKSDAGHILQVLKSTFESKKISFDTYMAKINTHGPRVMDVR